MRLHGRDIRCPLVWLYDFGDLAETRPEEKKKGSMSAPWLPETRTGTTKESKLRLVPEYCGVKENPHEDEHKAFNPIGKKGLTTNV